MAKKFIYLFLILFVNFIYSQNDSVKMSKQNLGHGPVVTSGFAAPKGPTQTPDQLKSKLKDLETEREYLNTRLKDINEEIEQINTQLKIRY